MIPPKVANAYARCMLLCLCVLACAVGQQKISASETAQTPLTEILDYIRSNWDVLTRSMTRCDTVVDPKLPEASLLYLPADAPPPEAVKKLQDSCKVRVEPLPAVIHHPGQPEVEAMKANGLLYLPNSYVVPGGRFNEMYGWDSYFIILGLIDDARLDLAKGMVENFFFEIEHYGTVLNANRTYYLTRSQPPFLTSMVLAVYNAEKMAHRADRAWLERAYTLAAQDYQMWVQEPHLAGTTGLSRYYDFGSGPAPESLQDEAGLGRKVAGYFLLRPEFARSYIVFQSGESVGAHYGVQVCEADRAARGCDPAGDVTLSADYYKGDRSMRESGFDVSFRFEPYGAATHHFAPVCLNSLLYKTEADLEQISRELGKPGDPEAWKNRADRRKALIDQYLWDARRGLFFDYNVATGSRSTYEYLTTFYPLWAGLATPAQAGAVAHNLKRFEQPGGLVTSRENSGAQWDYPYGWAPLHLLAIEGLRRYGYDSDADRVSLEFLSTVLKSYQREGTIREKYNVVTGSAEANVTVGYQANVVGFGWTNGVFLQLLRELPRQESQSLGKP
ncbi:MAG TPA: trehalase family glycosidase [Terriglobales bacterium]|nr:trehalase family glycosidase [Terriglobales bacterium]